MRELATVDWQKEPSRPSEKLRKHCSRDRAGLRPNASGHAQQFPQLGAAAGGVCRGLAEDEAGQGGIGWRFGVAGAVDQANGHIPAIVDGAADGAGQLPDVQ